MVGVDGSHLAQLALRWALTEAADLGCPLHLVHAWSVGIAHDLAWASRHELCADSRRMLRTALAAASSHVGVTVETVCHSVEGRPGAVLVRAAGHARLIVLGQRPGRRGSAGLGPVGAYCVHHSTVPVVLIPPAEPRADSTRPESS